MRYVPVKDRIIDSSDPDEGGCWRWRLFKSPDGYGRIRTTRGKRTMAMAHRASYEAFVGPIPEGMTIDHVCNVRDCVNPDHLRIATQQENILRGNNMAARFAARDRCPKCGGAFTDVSTVSERRRRCIPCRDAYNRTYAAANKERQRAYNQAYYLRRKSAQHGAPSPAVDE